MTAKHTPGPWKIGALESGQAAVDGADGSEVTGFISIPDAHLIAAAPELLHVAEMVLRGAADGALYGFAEAAVRKAKGKP